MYYRDLESSWKAMQEHNTKQKQIASARRAKKA